MLKIFSLLLLCLSWIEQLHSKCSALWAGTRKAYQAAAWGIQQDAELMWVMPISSCSSKGLGGSALYKLRVNQTVWFRRSLDFCKDTWLTLCGIPKILVLWFSKSAHWDVYCFERTQSIKKMFFDRVLEAFVLSTQPALSRTPAPTLLLYVQHAAKAGRFHLISSKCYRFNSYLGIWSTLSWFCVCYKVEIQIRFLHTDTQIHKQT